MLIYIYSDVSQIPLNEYKFDTIQKNPLNESNISLDSPGNYILVDRESYNARNKDIAIRQDKFRESPILDLNQLADELPNWNISNHNQREEKIENVLIYFFSN